FRSMRIRSVVCFCRWRRSWRAPITRTAAEPDTSSPNDCAKPSETFRKITTTPDER
ncbi:hypothetical protein M9458_049868, partial [Cirrhinus mrigala]